MRATMLILWAAVTAWAQAPASQPPPAQAQAPAAGERDLFVTVGKSVLVDSPTIIERVAVANAAVAEGVAISPHEVLVNAKTIGETSLIIWQRGGNRLFFDVFSRRNSARLDVVRHQMAEELGDGKVSMDLDGDTVYLRGTVQTISQANRAYLLASTLGTPVNLLRVAVPPAEPQILLKVRFIDVDRSAAKTLGLNVVSQNPNGQGSISTGQTSPPTVSGALPPTFQVTNALNLFFFRPDLNVGVTIAALQSKNLLQILAEPNVLATNGQTASFLEGGQFPYPTVQGGANAGAVTISFREFGVKLSFTPVVTARGKLRLTVEPEVSSLDYANGISFNGFTVPAIDTRRVHTEVELEDGQSFVIGGLLDNRVTKSLSKIPGLGDIPFFGKLFQSMTVNKSNTELLVLVSPEIVRPIPVNQTAPDLKMPDKFLPPNTAAKPPQTPGPAVTGPVPSAPEPAPIPIETLIRSEQGRPQEPNQFSPTTAAPATQPPPAPANRPPGQQPGPSQE